MGVRGLSSYLREKQRLLSTTAVIALDLSEDGKAPKPIVVDGWSFIYRLFDESENPWVYGGEYELFARDVEVTVTAWRNLRLEPHFIFDGAQPSIKFPEHINRIQESRILPANIFFRTSAVRRNEPTFQRDNSIIPPLMYGTCIAMLLDLHVSVVWAEGEADQRCVELASSLGTWVLGKDSDFSILNGEGYEGYAAMDQVTWEFQEEKKPERPAASSSEDGWSQATKNGKARHNRTTTSSTLLRHTLLPPSSSSIVSLSFVVYQPKTLAAHYKIPITFLPLFSSLVGNDFVPKSYKERLFDKRKTTSQNIERVGQVLYDVLSTGQDRRSKVGKLVEKNMTARGEAGNRPSVATLIQTAIQELLMRHCSGAEVDEMVETVIDAILQYGVESDPMGPFVQRLSSAPPLDQELVCQKYTEAYRTGYFAPRMLEMVINGCVWTNQFLEDPDVQTSGRTIATDVVTWIAAVLNDVISIGTPRDDLAGDTVSSLNNEEDEDELIDVIEEQTDSEDEIARGRQQQREETYDEDEDAYYTSYTNGVPVGLLTNALKKLRKDQRFRGGSSHGNSPKTASGCTSGVMSPAPGGGLAAVLVPRPTYITTYYRSGLRIVSHRLPVQPLSSLLDATSRGRPLLQSVPQWKGPIQLAPEDTRAKVFLHALHCDTARIRKLEGKVMVLVVSVRWAVIKMAERASQVKNNGDALKWRKNDAKAFLLTCMRATEDATQHPRSAVPRAIQLTSEILVALEVVQHLAEALLLPGSLKSRGIERMFSGRRFHSLLAAPVTTRDVEEKELLSMLWQAVEEDGKAEWWMSDAAPATPAPAPKKQKVRTTTSKPFGGGKPVSLYSALAALATDG